MSRDRFQFIYRWLTTWDPDQPHHAPQRLFEARGKKSKVRKSRAGADLWARFQYFSHHVQEVSQRLVSPGSTVSIDEMMVRFQGRDCNIVNMPNKPISIGFKLFAIAEQGYTFSWVPAACGGIRFPVPPAAFVPPDFGPPDKLTETQQLVIYLCTRLTPPPTRWRHLVCDNYFTSTKVFALLLRLRWYATGTAKQNRAGVVNKEKKRTEGLQPGIVKVGGLKNAALTKVPWGTVWGEWSEDKKVGFGPAY